MNVTLIGGISRLAPHYTQAAKASGHRLTIFTRYEKGMELRMGSADVLVLFTDHVSHSARAHALDVARSKGILLIQAHSCGISTWKACLQSLVPAEAQLVRA